MDRLLLQLLMLVGLIQLGLCDINCHQCSTLMNPEDCPDPYFGALMADDYLGECGGSYTHCTKYKTIIKLGDSGSITGPWRESVVVSRGCEFSPGASDGCYGTTANGGFVIKCRCSTDGCNSARGVMTSITLLLFGLLASKIFCYH